MYLLFLTVPSHPIILCFWPKRRSFVQPWNCLAWIIRETWTEIVSPLGRLQRGNFAVPSLLEIHHFQQEIHRLIHDGFSIDMLAFGEVYLGSNRLRSMPVTTSMTYHFFRIGHPYINLFLTKGILDGKVDPKYIYAGLMYPVYIGIYLL